MLAGVFSEHVWFGCYNRAPVSIIKPAVTINARMFLLSCAFKYLTLLTSEEINRHRGEVGFPKHAGEEGLLCLNLSLHFPSHHHHEATKLIDGPEQ